MELIRPFERLGKNDAGIAGGKGASLGEMTRAGIPVPPGFVILAEAFEKFIDATHLRHELTAILGRVNHEEMHTVEGASAEIQAMILGAEMPEEISDLIYIEYEKLGAEYVAVRSSATAEDSSTAAWAGQLDTYLNTTEEKLIENVQRCWASLFTPRAIFYRFEKGMQKNQISVAVVVQKMIESEVSGIAFSVHPVTEDYNQMIIEAGFGLGEAIVSGQVTPDSYVIEKEPRRIIDKNVTYQSKALWRGQVDGNVWRELSEVEGSKPALSDAQALELAELVLKIENHYGFPCDIEWAYETGQFFITQSRPITTLSGQNTLNTSNKEVTIFTKTVERDATLVGHALFAEAMINGLKEDFGIAIPFDTMELSYATKQSIQLWENKDGLAWLLDQLLNLNQKDATFIERVISEYKPLYAKLERYWNNSSFKKEDLADYFSTTKAAMVRMAICYYSGIDERTPQSVISRSVEMRKNDELYVSTDEFVRNCVNAFGRKRQLAHVVLPGELQSELPSNEELEKRLKGSILINGRDLTLNTLEQFTAAQPAYQFEGLRDDAADVSEIRGQTAQRGKVSGKVRIVKNRKESDNLQEGEVMVSPMTTPDFISGMQKAVAFVTDEGGVVCHAAIVAREMKKPCVIGTKIATQVLKDGDIVEVDADNGFVRKI